jgi:hypothetical protein
VIVADAFVERLPVIAEREEHVCAGLERLALCARTIA